MRTFLSIVAVAVLAISTAPGIWAQTPGEPGAQGQEPGELIDRVVAVVGDSIILYSEVAEEMARMEAQLQAQGRPLPEDPEERRTVEQEILRELVNQLLLLQAAEQDTLVEVTDSRVEATLREAWEDQIRRFGSEAELRRLVEAQGETLAQYRTSLREQIRRSLLLQSYMQAQRGGGQPVAVDEEEIRRIFEEGRGSLDQRPATITFRHLILQAEPSDSAKAAARERAEEILQMMREGEDFADLARRFSDDTGSAPQGGDLGWFRRGSGLVEAFEEAAFSLAEGQISGPVETTYGFHLIRVERVRGPERKLHHILVSTDRSDADEGRARQRATEIEERIRQGATFAEFSDEAAGVNIPDSLSLPVDQLGEHLPEAYAEALRNAGQGELIGPVQFQMGQGGPFFAITRIDEVREAGEYTYEDVRAQIRANLREQKFQERILEQLRRRTYVDIRL